MGVRLRAGGAGLLALVLVPVALAVPALARTDPWAEHPVVVELPFRTLYRDSKDVAPGVDRVVRPGRTGLLARVTGLGVVAIELLRPAADEVVLRGSWPGVEGPAVRECGTAAWSPGPGAAAAHRSLPLGTEVAVTDGRTGRRITVVINGRGAFAAGRVIDLSLDAFAALAPPAEGLDQVCLSWS
jgi:hypothetical protein